MTDSPSRPDTMRRQISVQANILDPEDGEAGIVEVFSGRVLARFPSVQSARASLRRNRAKYDAIAEGHARKVLA